MLKFELDSIDGVDENLKGFYEEADGGKYRLKVEGVPTVDNSLKESVEKLEAKNRELLEARAKAKKEAEEARLESAKKSGDVSAIEKSWQEKLEQREAELKSQLDQNMKMVSELTVGQTSSSLAAEIFGKHAKLMKPHVDSRLAYDVADGKPVVRVLDKTGKPSAMSVEELKAEFVNDEAFADFVVGTFAKGPGGHGKGGAPAAKVMKRGDFDGKSPAEKMAFVKDGGSIID